MASANVDMFFDDRNTARQTRGRYRYQDECVALRCIANLVSGQVTAVVVEWSTDYIAILAGGEPELVSVKHREPGQGDWPMSKLGPALSDLHRLWQAMDERCRCAFASSSAVAVAAMDGFEAKLGRYVEAGRDELQRFLRVLALPDPPLPRRTEITAVGVRDMAGALSLLDRDPGPAEQCYEAMVRRVAAIATEEPARPEERLARLTGSLQAVSARKHPRQREQTLVISDLRAEVLDIADEFSRRTPRPIRVVARPAVRGVERRTVGGEAFDLQGPLEQIEAPDGSYREERSDARPASGEAPELRLARIDVLRPSIAAQRRLDELADEAGLHRAIVGLPGVVAQDGSAFVTALPPGEVLPALYGIPPYPGIVLNALLRGLPTVARTLEALHASGRAHRALRPEALISSRDRISLRDVGLAAAAVAAGEGPDLYRAPEQNRPLLTPPGPATDVFQLAAIVYHLATGHPPSVSPPPPSLLRPGLSEELDAPLLRGLAETPERRPTLTTLVAALGAVRC